MREEARGFAHLLRHRPAVRERPDTTAEQTQLAHVQPESDFALEPRKVAPLGKRPRHLAHHDLTEGSCDEAAVARGGGGGSTPTVESERGDAVSKAPHRPRHLLAEIRRLLSVGLPLAKIHLASACFVRARRRLQHFARLRLLLCPFDPTIERAGHDAVAYSSQSSLQLLTHLDALGGEFCPSLPRPYHNTIEDAVQHVRHQRLLVLKIPQLLRPVLERLNHPTACQSDQRVAHLGGVACLVLDEPYPVLEGTHDHPVC
mmetsp:Transcript_16814/g.41419  ORF Transcript_16814/g.41419 Transcript_16814/m.41419 type:complete len:259 (-) Transcript_16814:1747-2523(-)